jgi:hypothetical protein
MRLRLGPALLFIALALGVAARASAQDVSPAEFSASRDAAPPPAPSGKKPSVGADVYVLFERESLNATQSFTAVLGTATVSSLGGGVDIVRIWKGAFARIAVARFTKTGTRVFVDSTLHVYPLNIPLTVTMTPVEVGGGWRLPSFDGKGHVVPYIGAAAVWLRYQESSMFADPSENTDTTFQGSALFAGIEGNVQRLNVGVEGLYRRVPQAVGAGGVSSTFKETDLGGVAVRLRVGVGF